MNIKVKAPGKIIFSGEHAVVYGHPALAMAVNRCLCVEIQEHYSPTIMFKSQSSCNFSQLPILRETLRRNHQGFLAGELPVQQILSDPTQLPLFAVSLLFEAFDDLPSTGFNVDIQSTIPIGCGMGSSAALILSVIQAVSAYFKWDMTVEQFYRLALEAENLQHGKSSGIDLRTIIQGGCIYRHGEKIIPHTVTPVKMYLINTGTPASTTGACVAHAAKYFKSSIIGNDFEAVTQELTRVLTTDSALSDLKNLIRKNHQLLKTIGVVPQRVERFIETIESRDGAAKICGAGAVSGDHAGMVLVIMEDLAHLEKISTEFGYTLLPIQCEPRGVHVI